MSAPAAMHGAYANVVSLSVFNQLAISLTMPAHAPIMHVQTSIAIASSIPKRKPKTVSSLMSPPPMPPILFPIIKTGTKAITAPAKRSSKLGAESGKAYPCAVSTLAAIPSKSTSSTKMFGMLRVRMSIMAAATRMPAKTAEHAIAI